MRKKTLSKPIVKFNNQYSKVEQYKNESLIFCSTLKNNDNMKHDQWKWIIKSLILLLKPKCYFTELIKMDHQNFNLRKEKI